MTCTCPKCHVQIEVDLSKTPDNGTFLPCPECKDRFWINRESYARMALKKEGNSYCDKCGNKLDHSIVCTACGIMYPDYYLVQSSKPPRRKIEKADLFSLSFTLKPAKPTSAYLYTASTGNSETNSSKIVFKRLAYITVCLLIIAGAGLFYHKKKTEELYVKNYMRALYTIKTGSDLSYETCAKITSDWKEKSDAGRLFTPRISEEDETRLNMVKDASDRWMKKLNDPPKKFLNSREKLANLYDSYSKINSLALAPSGSLSLFANSTNKSHNDFIMAAQELKKSLPSEFSAEFQIAKNKYKNLNDI